jgi:bifunctional non-homologous end joining protein LigD
LELRGSFESRLSSEFEALSSTDLLSPIQLLDRVFPPMLATLVSEPPADQERWAYELKYDGFRALAGLIDGKVALWSRNRLDLGARFPSVPKELSKLRIDSAVLDGEIVALDSTGTPRFQLLQQGGATGTAYIVFDVLFLNGRDLRKQPLEHRRELLETLLRSAPKAIRISERLEGPGSDALRMAADGGHEGLIAKCAGSPYEGRRSKLWLKIKADNQQEIAIVGFTPMANGSDQIGALLVGVMQDGRMVYAGKVGTGFSTKLRVRLKRDLSRDVVSKPMVEGAPRYRGATWVRPRLVGQVRFTEWTADGRLRHPSFLGLRPDKTPEDVVREKPEPGEGGRKPAGSRAARKSHGAKKPAEAPLVVLTSPDRLLYPRDGITKKDVAAYYDLVSEPMIRALDGRPLALEHWNQGIDRPSWFHQDVRRDAERWMTTAETPTRTSSRSISHLIVDRPETLRWLAQRSVLTVHMWSSRVPNLETPDWMVFDLDPAKGKGIEQAIEAAILLRKLFDHMEFPSVPKTSGKRGIHVLVPLKPGYSHEQAADFACKVSDTLASKVDFLTTERTLDKRRGRLYVDCMQNVYGKTIVAPYSLRGVDGAPVSAPLKWSEVTRRLDPMKFNLRTMPKRLEKVGDLFADVLKGGIRLPRTK